MSFGMRSLSRLAELAMRYLPILYTSSMLPSDYRHPTNETDRRDRPLPAKSGGPFEHDRASSDPITSPSAFRIERLLAKVEAEVERRRLRARRYVFHPDEVAEAEAQGLPYVLVPRVLSSREWMERYGEGNADHPPLVPRDRDRQHAEPSLSPDHRATKMREHSR